MSLPKECRNCEHLTDDDKCFVGRNVYDAAPGHTMCKMGPKHEKENYITYGLDEDKLRKVANNVIQYNEAFYIRAKEFRVGVGFRDTPGTYCSLGNALMDVAHVLQESARALQPMKDNDEVPF